MGEKVGKKSVVARERKTVFIIYWGVQNPAHAQEVVASVKKLVDEVGAVLFLAIDQTGRSRFFQVLLYLTCPSQFVKFSFLSASSHSFLFVVVHTSSTALTTWLILNAKKA